MLANSTRERLLDSAYQIISERSLSQLTVENVTACAHLSARTFFLHFSSKDELVTELLKRLRSTNAAMFRQWSYDLDVSLSVEERITKIFRRFIDHMTARQWTGCCFTRLSAEFHELRGHPLHEVVAAAKRDMEHWLEEELRRGDFESPAWVARQLTTILNGIMVMQMMHGTPDYGEEILSLLPGILSQCRNRNATQGAASPARPLYRYLNPACGMNTDEHQQRKELPDGIPASGPFGPGVAATIHSRG